MIRALGTTTAAAAQQKLPNQFSALRNDPQNKQLGQDVRDLGSIMAKVMEKDTLEKVQRLRKLAVDWRGTGDDAAFQEMASVARVLGVRELHEVWAFSHFGPLQCCRVRAQAAETGGDGAPQARRRN